MYHKDTWLDEINLMIGRGSKVTKLLNMADELSDGDKSLTKLFLIVQNVMKDRLQEGYKAGSPRYHLSEGTLKVNGMLLT